MRTGTPAFARGFEGGDLVAGQLQHLRRRADERDACVFGGPGQVRVLGQESVARVDCVGTRLFGDTDDFVHVEVGTDRMALLADQVRLISLLAVDRVTILVREHRYSLGAQLVAGAEGADRDFAAVSHQNLGKHASPASLRVYLVSGHSV